MASNRWPLKDLDIAEDVAALKDVGAAEESDLSTEEFRGSLPELTKLEQERTMYQVAELWVQGYSVNKIAHRLKLDYRTVLKMLQRIRPVFVSWYEDTLKNLAAERIHSLREVLKQCWSELEDPDLSPHSKQAYLQLITKVEELIGKIQGVVSERHLHLAKVEHTIKYYDFVDNLPSPTETSNKDLIEVFSANHQPPSPSIPAVVPSELESADTPVFQQSFPAPSPSESEPQSQPRGDVQNGQE